jgi:hypothetical protein
MEQRSRHNLPLENTALKREARRGFGAVNEFGRMLCICLMILVSLVGFIYAFTRK